MLTYDLNNKRSNWYLFLVNDKKLKYKLIKKIYEIIMTENSNY